jgi:hypothetical protein
MKSHENTYDFNLNDIASPDGSTYYLAGNWILPDGKGWRRLLYCCEGDGDWRSLTGPEFEDGINALYVESEETIWLLCRCSVQSGNKKAGFVDRRPRNTDISYDAMARFGRDLYIGSTKGLFRVEDDALVQLHDIDFVSATGGWIRHLIAVDDVLWIFGVRGIVRYDGGNFEPIVMPSMGQFR